MVMFFWNSVRIKPLGGNKISIMDKEYDISRYIEEYFTKINISTRPRNNDKLTVFDILEKTRFYSKKHKGLNSAGMRDALYELPKTIAKVRNPLLSLPPAENEESEKNLIFCRVKE